MSHLDSPFSTKFIALLVCMGCLVSCQSLRISSFGQEESDIDKPAKLLGKTKAAYQFDHLIETARQAAQTGTWSDQHLAGSNTSSAELPAELAEMDYDDHIGTTFDPAYAMPLSPSPGYTLEGFHRGWLHTEAVHVEIVHDGIARPWDYQSDAFTFSRRTLQPNADWKNLGWAGVRINRPWADDRPADELLVILGATYYRALGLDSTYGASGRLIAVNTGIFEMAESFPRITCLWIHQADDPNDPLRIDGLIDGEHLTAAFALQLRPGQTTAIDVDMHIFTCKPIRKLGLAPITSMFLFGPEPDPRFQDERPEVHDNDGLLAHVPNAVYWQPLRNPLADRTTRLTGSDTTGFGLMQRERRFNRYLDPMTRHERRPDVWVQPTNDWPKGSVELLELSRTEEKHDNIGSYFAVDNVPAGKSMNVQYTVYFGSPIHALRPPMNQTDQLTRTTRDIASGPALDSGTDLDLDRLARAERVVFARTTWPHWSILFDGPVLRDEYADKPFTVVATDRDGVTVAPRVEQMPDGKWRVHFSEDVAYPVDVRLEDFGKHLSETVRLREPMP